MKKTETTSTVLLKHHLKALRLPTVWAECEKVAQRCATDNVDHLGYLLQLCELELLDRERRAAAQPVRPGPHVALQHVVHADLQPGSSLLMVGHAPDLRDMAALRGFRLRHRLPHPGRSHLLHRWI